jgi:hypothetical protein
LRLLPFLTVCYFVAYLDRLNAGFASLTTKREPQHFRSALEPVLEKLAQMHRADHVHLGAVSPAALASEILLVDPGRGIRSRQPLAGS